MKTKHPIFSRTLLLLLTLVLTLTAGAIPTLAATDTPEYTTSPDIVGYSAALVERKDLSEITNIQKYYEDQYGDITNYKITNAEDLMFFSQAVKDKQTFAGITVYLENDIDLSGVENFAPIGGWTPKDVWAAGPAFEGTFDGQGYSIKNMSMVAPTEDADKLIIAQASGYVGFFRLLRAGATIKNLVFDETCTVSGGTNKDIGPMGVLCGAVDSGKGITTSENDTVTIFNIYSKATLIHGGGVAGGIVAYVKSMHMTMDHCTNATTMKLVENEPWSKASVGRGVGGLVGKVAEYGENKLYPVSLKITNSRNAGDVVSCAAPAGGFVGHILELGNYETTSSDKFVQRDVILENCINNGDVTMSTEDKAERGVGGFIGLIAVQNPQANISLKGCKNYAVIKEPISVIWPSNEKITQFDELFVRENRFSDGGAGVMHPTVIDCERLAGQTDSTLAEALWQNLVPIKTEGTVPPPVIPDKDPENGDGNANASQDNTTGKDNDSPQTTETAPSAETEAPEKSKGCGSSIAVIPVAIGIVCGVAIALKKKEEF